MKIFYENFQKTKIIEEDKIIDFVTIKEKILILLIQTDSNFMKNYSSYIYDFLLFSIEPVKNKTSHLSFFGDFVEELWGGFEINVTLKQ